MKAKEKKKLAIPRGKRAPGDAGYIGSMALIQRLNQQNTRLSKQGLALLVAMLLAFKEQREGHNYAAKSIENDLRAIIDLVLFTGKPPWQWTKEDIDAWKHYLVVERGVWRATQRRMLCSARTFHTYIAEREYWQLEVHKAFGMQIPIVFTSSIMVPHLFPREQKVARMAVDQGHLVRMTDAIKQKIRELAAFGGKGVITLLRDLVMFITIYVCGLRASEALGLNVSSFEPDPRRPEFGPFGRVRVQNGKASRGSGPRPRVVHVLHPGLPKLLAFYLKHVRPRMLKSRNPNEPALFLSEQGTRLCVGALEARFRLVVRAAGLEEYNYVIHCLRHAFVSHLRMAGLDPEIVRMLAGHSNLTVTDDYTHYTTEFIQEQMRMFANLPFPADIASDDTADATGDVGDRRKA